MEWLFQQILQICPHIWHYIPQSQHHSMHWTDIDWQIILAIISMHWIYCHSCLHWTMSSNWFASVGWNNLSRKISESMKLYIDLDQIIRSESWCDQWIVKIIK
jgi:hypothetical protein